MTTRDDILTAALQLPEPDRLILANQLMDTLPEDLPGLSDDSPEFLEELERRSGDQEGTVSWDDLRDDLSRRLRQS